MKTTSRVIAIILLIPNIGNIMADNPYPVIIIVNLIFIYFGWMHSFDIKESEEKK